MNAFRRWLRRIPGWLLTVVCAGILAAIFGLGWLWWWLANHMAWWTFALFFVASELYSPMIKAVRGHRRAS